jgi:hypothetical protein
MRNDLLMSSAALANGTRRLVRHGKIPIHVRHVLDWLLGHVHAKADTEFKVYSISATDLFRQLGVKRYPSPTEAEQLVQAVGGYTTLARVGRIVVSVHWVERAAFDPDTGVFHFQLSEQLRPFLLDLKRDYSQLRVRDLLRLKSGYSHQLYMIVSRFEPLHRKSHRMPLPEFCDSMHVPSDHKARADWRRLQEKILAPATAEVREKTGLSCTITPLRQHNRKRGDVEAIEITNIAYRPELVEDLEREDDRQSDAYQRKVDRRARQRTDQTPEPKQDATATTTECDWQPTDRVEYTDPFADL